jgi:hypothetical protein
MHRIHFWRKKVREAAHSLHAAMLAELPVGTSVEYLLGDHTITVIVIAHGSVQRLDPNLKVRGKSGKEYWIDLSRITRIAE